MSISARLYEHASFGGRSTYVGLPYETPVDTYRQVPKSWLDSVNLNERISSADLTASDNESGARLILFQDNGYRGEFVSFWVGGGATVTQVALSDVAFNDRTSSALLVRQFRRETPPIAIGSLGSPSLRDRAGDIADNTPSSPW